MSRKRLFTFWTSLSISASTGCRWILMVLIDPTCLWVLQRPLDAFHATGSCRDRWYPFCRDPSDPPFAWGDKDALFLWNLFALLLGLISFENRNTIYFYLFMIHPWVDSRKFLLMQPKMTYWNLFLMRFKSWFMTPSGFSWFVSRINTEDSTRRFFWVLSGDSNQDLDWIISWFSWGNFEPVFNQDSFDFVLSFFWVTLGWLEDWINESTQDHFLKPPQG